MFTVPHGHNSHSHHTMCAEEKGEGGRKQAPFNLGVDIALLVPNWPFQRILP